MIQKFNEKATSLKDFIRGRVCHSNSRDSYLFILFLLTDCFVLCLKDQNKHKLHEKIFKSKDTKSNISNDESEHDKIDLQKNTPRITVHLFQRTLLRYILLFSNLICI